MTRWLDFRTELYPLHDLHFVSENRRATPPKQQADVQRAAETLQSDILMIKFWFDVDVMDTKFF